MQRRGLRVLLILAILLGAVNPVPEPDPSGATVGTAAVASSAGEAWVLHAGGEWSGDHLERDPRDVVPGILSAFAEALDHPLNRLASDSVCCGNQFHHQRSDRISNPAGRSPAPLSIVIASPRSRLRADGVSRTSR